MNPGTVARIPPDEYLSAPHGVARGITHVSVNHNTAGIHRIPHRVLGISEDLDLRSVQVSAQGIPRDSGNRDPLIRHTRTQEAVAQAIDDPAVSGLPNPIIQGGIIHIPGIQ